MRRFFGYPLRSTGSLAASAVTSCARTCAAHGQTVGYAFAAAGCANGCWPLTVSRVVRTRVDVWRALRPSSSQFRSSAAFRCRPPRSAAPASCSHGRQPPPLPACDHAQGLAESVAHKVIRVFTRPAAVDSGLESSAARNRRGCRTPCAGRRSQLCARAIADPSSVPSAASVKPTSVPLRTAPVPQSRQSTANTATGVPMTSASIMIHHPARRYRPAKSSPVPIALAVLAVDLRAISVALRQFRLKASSRFFAGTAGRTQTASTPNPHDHLLLDQRTLGRWLPQCRAHGIRLRCPQ